jgi:eight-cysteine-cluster-containing protein
MRFVIMSILAVLLCVGCGAPTENTAPPQTGTPGDQTGTPETGEPAVRTAAVSADVALFARVEGADVSNACASDADCKSTGCSKEVCAAEEVMTSCEVQEWPQGQGASCGCVEKQCVWYR